MTHLLPVPLRVACRLAGTALGLATLSACGAIISESEFGGRWRIAEHRIELHDGDDYSSVNPGFFDCNAAYAGAPDTFTGGFTIAQGCIFFLNQQFDPVAMEFVDVIDPSPQLVQTTVDTDVLEEQVAVLSYAGGQVPFGFERITGGYEMRALDVVWDGTAPPYVSTGSPTYYAGTAALAEPDLDIVLLVTKE